jgi:hypothetical protein
VKASTGILGFFTPFFPLGVEKHNSPFSRDSLPSLSIVLTNLFETLVASLVTAAILMFHFCSSFCFLKNCATLHIISLAMALMGLPETLCDDEVMTHLL